jgi:hypothetical protein
VAKSIQISEKWHHTYHPSSVVFPYANLAYLQSISSGQNNASASQMITWVNLYGQQLAITHQN